MRHHVRIGRTMARAAAVPLVALATVLGMAGSAQAEPPALGKKEIVYALPGGGSALVMVSVASRMLEAVGYEVDHRTITTGLVYPALANGDVDVFSSAFLPGQQSHVNKYEDKLDFLGTSYAPVPSGLMAPAYVPFNTIEDLADPAVRDSLEGEIHSGGAGWGVSIRASETIDAYGLDFSVVNSSGPVMAAAFKKAYDRGEPVLITGWCPHYLCALYQTKFLTDTKGIWTYSQDYYIARLGFREDHPRAAVLLGRLNLDVDLMSQMLVWMETEGIDEKAAADRLLAQHRELQWYWAGDLGGNVEKPDNLK